MQNADHLGKAGLAGREARLRLVEKISTADGVEAAACALKQHFLAFDSHLLSVKFCDSADPGNAIRPFTAYPKDVLTVSQQLLSQGGCPFSKEAVRRLQAYDSCTIDRSQYATFLDRRFFMEMDKTGHQHIAIVPVMLGRAVALFTVGLLDKPFKGELRELIVEAIGQSVPAFIDRFQGIKTLFEKKHLSELERKVIQRVCEGLPSSQIEKATGLSEFTVSMLMQNAARKLQASNSQSLIYKALALGEISHSPVMRSFENNSQHK
ncbi:MAG: LuxR C-terminal-related transcriptional regulator [Rhizobiaceae bacterium]